MNESDSAAIELFIRECRFAKCVRTATGFAIEVCGEIVDVNSSNPEFHAFAISSALRIGGESLHQDEVRNPSEHSGHQTTLM